MIGQFRNSGTHAGPLAVIAIATAPEHAQQTAGGSFTQGLKYIAQGVFGMGIINVHMPRISGILDAFKAARHGSHLP